MVQAQLKRLIAHKSTSLDGIRQQLLKSLAPLTSIFTYTLEAGKKPADLKRAAVTSIYKKGLEHDTTNGWPVSLT